ncbi:MAG: glucosaminidase domain-containing protein [Culturomica sp.]|jgi:LysM repeat protein|nr:glucosaminidase domain-containing protein [Culturomica sp.]
MKIIYQALAALLLTVSFFSVFGEERKEFIHKYRQIAVREMERTGIPASIKLAQGILESGCGVSELALQANNHFGIKCHNWEGASFHMDDDEANECFRKYTHPEQSWKDHSEFLTSRPRYAGLFELAATDYRGWAKGLKAAGYATNPKYAEMLIKIIEEEELFRYDHPVKKQLLADARAQKPASHVQTATPAAVKHTVKSPVDYRLREEMINGLICIKIKEEDKLDHIARYYSIKIHKLKTFNDLHGRELTPGEYLFLQKKKNKAARGYEFHRVKAGEKLLHISQQYGVRLKSLMKYNHLEATTPLQEGDRIFLRAKDKMTL